MSTLKRLAIPVFLLGALLLASPLAPAQDERTTTPVVTYDKVLEYLRLEVKEEKIIRLVQASPTTFTLGKDQIAELKKAGASDKLIEALRKKGQTVARDSDVRAFVLILDCSGSMKDAAEGGATKWEAAQAAAISLIQSIPEGRELAFVVYGHDLQRECQAVDVLRPLSPLDAAGKAKLRRAVEDLQPVGHTPIANSLRKAGGELARSRELAKLILITDGMETCHGDPTREAAQLVSKYPHLRGGVDVIGFGLKEEESAAVARIAKAGRGKYHDAKTAKQLNESVKAVERKIARADPAPKGPPPKSPPPGVPVLKGHTSQVRAVNDNGLMLGVFVGGTYPNAALRKRGLLPFH